VKFDHFRSGPKSAPVSPVLAKMRDTAARLQAAGTGDSDSDDSDEPTNHTPETPMPVQKKESHIEFAKRVHRVSNPSMKIQDHFDRVTLAVASAGWARYFAANPTEMASIGLRTPADLVSFLMLELGNSRG